MKNKENKKGIGIRLAELANEHKTASTIATVLVLSLVSLSFSEKLGVVTFLGGMSMAGVQAVRGRWEKKIKASGIGNISE